MSDSTGQTRSILGRVATTTIDTSHNVLRVSLVQVLVGGRRQYAIATMPYSSSATAVMHGEVIRDVLRAYRVFRLLTAYLLRHRRLMNDYDLDDCVEACLRATDPARIGRDRDCQPDAGVDVKALCKVIGTKDYLALRDLHAERIPAGIRRLVGLR